MTVSVLHVIPSVSMAHGGPSKAIVMMEEALGAAGIVVMTATTDDDGPGRRFAEHGMPPAGGGAQRYYARKWTEFYKVAPGLAWWLWKNLARYDLVHIHALFSFSSVAASCIARWRGVPYIIRPLGTIAAYGMAERRPALKALSFALVERRILTGAAAVHFTSQSEWDEARVLGGALRGVVIPLGVHDVVSAEPGVASRELRRPDHRVTILFMSRLDRKKNLEGLLQAVARIVVPLPHVRLAIAGEGEVAYVASLKTLAQSLGLADRVTWLGFVDGDRKAAALHDADVFVLPSWSENFGIAVVEALFAGLPCVVGRGVAVGQQVADAGAGLVVEPVPEQIADALMQVLQDDGLRSTMRARARELAQSHYSSEAMARGLISLYQTVANRAGSHAT